MWKSLLNSLNWFARLPNSLTEDITNQYRLKKEGFELAYIDGEGREKRPPIQWGRIAFVSTLVVVITILFIKLIKLIKK